MDVRGLFVVMFMETTIDLKLREFGGREYLYISTAYDQGLIGTFRRIQAQWSSQFRAWYIPSNQILLYKLRGMFHPHRLDTMNLPACYLLETDLTQAQLEYLKKFDVYLRGARYSSSTVSTYTGWLSEFLFFHRKKDVEVLAMSDVHVFNEGFILKRSYSVSSQRQFIGAIKLFFTHIADSHIIPEELERPHKDKKLPEVLSKEEVTQILTCTQNLKHKCLLATVYSCGLRVGEVLNLRLPDIDSNRMLVHVRMSKGRKDRYVRLGHSNLALLRAYYREHTPRDYLFEGPSGGPYSSSSIRKILGRSVRKAGIRKSVTPHTLRHSYATHLLELGVDIRYIQAMLGHRRPETTMIYTHISSHKVSELPNPLDEIVRDELTARQDMWNRIPNKNPLIPLGKSRN